MIIISLIIAVAVSILPLWTRAGSWKELALLILGGLTWMTFFASAFGAL